MACNICGTVARHHPSCPIGRADQLRHDERIDRRLAPTGWLCPACGKGNAPDVKGCVHCTADAILSRRK